MASDGSTSAWSALKAAVWRYPALSVLVALLLPLLGAAALFLAPFAIPLGVVALVFLKKSGPATTTPEEAEDVDCAASRVAARPERWAIIAEHSGLVGAWRLMQVCSASREGAKDWLRTLPGLVVCGRLTGGEVVSDVWRLDLATMRWEPMPALVTARSHHTCCAVRGALVVLGGPTPAGHHGHTSSVEMLPSSEEGGAFVDLPPLSCGGIRGAAAIAVGESYSAAGQVLLLGGWISEDVSGETLPTVQLVDLATGACAPQPGLLHPRGYAAAGRLPDGRVVCAGGFGDMDGQSSAEVWGALPEGAADAAWSWRALPGMSTDRYGCCGCAMSDGRFAVLGGHSNHGDPTSSCEALVVDGAAHWEPLPPMHESWAGFACGAVAGCVIVAGGPGRRSAEVYVEELNRWLRLPCDLPYRSTVAYMGSAVL
jgi:hypothetical protein